MLEPIGVVRSTVRELVDDGWGQISEIHLNAALAPGLNGLEQFSHALVVYLMHQTATFVPARDLVRRPRGRSDMPELGIFAQRAKHRPNPIGVTAVEIVRIDKHVLTVRRLDAVDGTPVLDLKPYVPAFDRIAEPREPEWMKRLMEGYFS